MVCSLQRLFSHILSVISRYKSFADIQTYIKQNETNSAELLKYLVQLKEACQVLTGEQPDEVIEDAAILCLRMFLDVDIVMLKHLSQLRQLFGSVQSSTANKICEVGKVLIVVYTIVVLDLRH